MDTARSIATMRKPACHGSGSGCRSYGTGQKSRPAAPKPAAPKAPRKPAKPYRTGTACVTIITCGAGRRGTSPTTRSWPITPASSKRLSDGVRNLHKPTQSPADWPHSLRAAVEAVVAAHLRARTEITRCPSRDAHASGRYRNAPGLLNRPGHPTGAGQRACGHGGHESWPT